MADPTTTNAAATATSAGISTAVGDIVTAAENMAIAQWPFLAYPGFKQIWEAVFGWFANLFSKAAQTGATFAIIDVQTMEEEGALSVATAEILKAEKDNNHDELIQAEKDYAAAESALMHADGSASPQ